MLKIRSIHICKSKFILIINYLKQQHRRDDLMIFPNNNHCIYIRKQLLHNTKIDRSEVLVLYITQTNETSIIISSTFILLQSTTHSQQHMNCHCCSKQLYSQEYSHPQSTFLVNGQPTHNKRRIDDNLIANSHPYPHLENKIIESTEMWMPNQIDHISWSEVSFNPFWFHQKYLSKNIPCIITDVFEGDDIFERWSSPQYLCQALEGQTQSISLTSDGFADSIHGQYFIEPYEQKRPLKDFFNHSQTFPNAIPYIQHQNASLSNEFSSLNCEVSQQVVKHLSECFFKGKEPDAENLWLGYDQSVSAIHKDPYQNFYMTIVGEKHFTLMPPHSILFLEEQQYESAKWNYQQGKFSCEPTGSQNSWICVNPDLENDRQRFKGLKQAQSYHITLKKEEMLYLPSLWYHQVSQCQGKDPYTLAINYWFDMEFTQNFSLYQTCRSLRNFK